MPATVRLFLEAKANMYFSTDKKIVSNLNNIYLRKLIGFYIAFSRAYSISRNSHRRCLIKRCSSKSRHIHMKIHVPESLFLSFIQKEALAQAFSCEFGKIFRRTFFNRTPPGDCFHSQEVSADKTLFL